MIRVNLLPQKRRKASSSRGELWLVASLLTVALEIVGCLVLYGQKQDELVQQQDKNKALDAQIKQIKDVSKNHDEVKQKLAALRDREQAIAKLQSARTGPTAMLLEVARLLTPGRGPSVDPNELSKVRRVIEGRLEGAPHETLLVVDATTGQNGLQQARLFGESAGVTGVALTKLDGSARGGVAVAIAYELGLPVKLVGVGEALDDLRPFDPREFARALVAG